MRRAKVTYPSQKPSSRAAAPPGARQRRARADRARRKAPLGARSLPAPTPRRSRCAGAAQRRIEFRLLRRELALQAVHFAARRRFGERRRGRAAAVELFFELLDPHGRRHVRGEVGGS